MKGLKKLLTGVLAGAMALSMAFGTGAAVKAEAAGNGSITVGNTTVGKEYKLYKVFDATYTTSEGEDGKESTTAAYTYDGSNEAFLAALNSESSPFSLVGKDAPYNVVTKEGASDTAIIEFIKANGPVLDETTNTWSTGNFGDAVKSEKAKGSSLTFSGLDYGYYFITSSLGATVTINNATPSANVIDKNQEITIDKQESVDGTNWEYVGEFDEKATAPTAKVGDTVNYQVVGTLTQYIGEEKATKFTFTDTMDSGLTRNEKVEVVLGSTDVTEQVSIKVEGQTLTIDVPAELVTESSVPYVITYSAVINENAVVKTEQDNTVTIKYNDKPDFDTDKTRVKNYQITLTKADGLEESATKLAGAKFKLYTSETGNTEIPVVLVKSENDHADYGTAKSTVNNVYRVAKAGEEAVEMVTGTTGKIEVKGLENGDYYFEETEAPAGYNKLTARTEVTTISNADGTITVVNKTGSLLPSTGGIGTTIFYIIGGVLIIAGVAYFMVRRKVDAE